MAAIEAQSGKARRHLTVRAGWFAAALLALGLGVVGAVSLPEKVVTRPKPLPAIHNGEVRTTPDTAPHEMPPPVEQAR